MSPWPPIEPPWGTPSDRVAWPAVSRDCATCKYLQLRQTGTSCAPVRGKARFSFAQKAHHSACICGSHCGGLSAKAVRPPALATWVGNGGVGASASYELVEWVSPLFP